MTTDQLLDSILEEAENLRPGYVTSLGNGDIKIIESMEKILGSILPKPVRNLYSKVQGTVRTIKEQEYFDFIPGYRLIHVNELAEKIELFSTKMKGVKTAIPILENYSSDFIMFVYKESNLSNGVYLYTHDDNTFELLSNTDIDFLNTIQSFYNNGVYFIDDDNFLDFDFEKEGTIGQKINPGISYWQAD